MGKSILNTKQIVTSGDMSGNITSDTIGVERLDNVGIQLQWTGTPTGDFFVDARIHEDAPWTELSISPSVAASGSASDWLISLTQIPYSELRVRYERSAGTGTLEAWLMAKQVGG